MTLSLGDCRSWAEVEIFFDNLEDEYRKDPSNLDIQALQSFKRLVLASIGDHDFNRDSVQKRCVDWFESNRGYLEAGEVISRQDEMRKMGVFHNVARNTFGEDWDRQNGGWNVLGLVQLLKNYEPDTANVVFGSLKSGSYEVEDVKALVDAIMSRPSHRTDHPFETPQSAILRHWTDPDFPLFLMSDKALCQAVRYLSSGSFISEKSVVTTIKRLGLERLRHRPISGVQFDASRGAKRRKFKSYDYRSYIKKTMDNVTISTRGAEETRRWFG